MKNQHSAAELRRAAESVVIAIAQQGSSQAFSEIVRRRHRHVRNFMNYQCGNPDYGDDLAQQVFLKAWRSLHQLKSAGAFGGWLKKIMVTTWLEEVRRKGIAYSAEMDSAEIATCSDMTTQIMDLDTALARLPAAMRLCVVLAYHEGMTHEEIAAVTAIPLGTVKSNISRGSARMREILSAYGAGG